MPAHGTSCAAGDRYSAASCRLDSIPHVVWNCHFRKPFARSHHSFVSKSVVCILKLDPTTRYLYISLYSSSYNSKAKHSQKKSRFRMSNQSSYWADRRKIRKLVREEISASCDASRLIASGGSVLSGESCSVDSVPTQLSNLIRQDSHCSPASKARCVELPPDSEIPAVMAESSEPGKAADVTPLLSVPAQLDSTGQACESEDGTSEEDIVGEDDQDELSFHEFLDEIERRDSSVEELSESDTDDGEQKAEKTNFALELMFWATSFGITQAALSALLAILRLFHPDLLKDGRTLLRTPRSTRHSFSIKGSIGRNCVAV